MKTDATTTDTSVTEETSAACSGVLHDSELTFTEKEGTNAKQDHAATIQREPASEPADHSASHYLNFMDYPQTLEYSDLITTLPSTNEMLWNVDAEEDGTEMHMDDDSSSDHDLYKDAPITTAQSSSVLLMKFIMKHRITQEALSDLLKVLQLHCPTPNNFPSTVYHFKKQFKDFQHPINYHYFCSKCLAEVSTESEVCDTCKSSLIEVDAKSSFIEVPINLQLKCILERKHTFYVNKYNVCCM